MRGLKTNSLMSDASKVLLKVLSRRVCAKLNDLLGEDQFDFRKEKGTIASGEQSGKRRSIFAVLIDLAVGFIELTRTS